VAFEGVFQRMLPKLFYGWDSFRNAFTSSDIAYIVEPANWSIREDGYNICRYLPPELVRRVTCSDRFLKTSLAHYGSINMFDRDTKTKKNARKTVVTWFHADIKDPKLARVNEFEQRVDLWHTASTRMAKQLVSAGIPPDRVVVIPLGIDLEAFFPVQGPEKQSLRAENGIPEDAFVIGSFQKDGEGWGKGETPKVIKGPDIFCDVAERLAQKTKLFVILTGPARGYVKHRLERAGIPYKHVYVKRARDVARYYHLLDAYIVSSRVEGGPKALLEAQACGVPLVTTDVGMVPDIIRDGVNALVSPVGDVDSLDVQVSKIMQSLAIREKLIDNGFNEIRNYHQKEISKQYFHKIYSKLLEI
jgi:glycosyltransferase involved in cell wall biosynthesis